MIRLSKFDQAKGLDFIEQMLKFFVAPYLDPQQAMLTMQHLQWMKDQKSGMNVECRFETHPHNQVTEINLQINFGEAPKKIING